MTPTAHSKIFIEDKHVTWKSACERFSRSNTMWQKQPKTHTHRHAHTHTQTLTRTLTVTNALKLAVLRWPWYRARRPWGGQRLRRGTVILCPEQKTWLAWDQAWSRVIRCWWRVPGNVENKRANGSERFWLLKMVTKWLIRASLFLFARLRTRIPGKIQKQPGGWMLWRRSLGFQEMEGAIGRGWGRCPRACSTNGS